MTADPGAARRLDQIQIRALIVGCVGLVARSGGVGDLAGPLFPVLPGWISVLAGD